MQPWLRPPCKHLCCAQGTCSSPASRWAGHMQLEQRTADELPLQELAARYGDSDSEGEVPQRGPSAQEAQGGTQQPPATPPAAAPPAGAGAQDDSAAAQGSGSGSEEWDEDDEDWDSEDEELASALEWADLREGAGCSAAALGGWVGQILLVWSTWCWLAAVLAWQRVACSS